ncbi:MAG TPA: hypothetical protein VGF91_10150 [Solirubrobacteraceae bacterium]|jgi:hypothetical protein
MFVVVASAFRASWEPEREDLGGALETALRDRGHEVDSLRIPFDPDPDALWSQLFAVRMTNISDVGELLVATDAPCHLLRHRHKVLWLTEHYPWLEDESAALGSLSTADRQALGEARAAFAVSRRLQERIARSSGSGVGLLSPPGRGSWDRVIGTLIGIDSGSGSR